MAQVKDPVCGMLIDSDTAAGKTEYEGKTYYFCSAQCLRQFDGDPGRYAGMTGTSPEASDNGLERHEPPYTKSGGIVAPKFGAAGSGGAEYERLPETHDDRNPSDR